MNVIIGNETEVSSNLEDIMGSIEEKINGAILVNKMITVYVLSSEMECRNAIVVEDYELNEHYFSLTSGWYELHINLDNVIIEHNNDGIGDHFIFIENGMKTDIVFMG